MVNQDKTAQKLSALKKFIPPESFSKVLYYFKKYPVFLTIKRERVSVYGDYRPPNHQKPFHRISVNGNLNPYSFLITLLHEMAHLLNYIHHGHRVSPHGASWQHYYRMVLNEFLGKGIFPKELEAVIRQSLKKVKAATCNDPDLYRALRAYDKSNTNTKLIEEIPVGSYFNTANGKRFKMLGKVRTRYKCLETATNKEYSFHAMAEVIPLKQVI